jgi:hypothetical protein
MVFDDPATTSAPTRLTSPFRKIAAIQGGYFLITGLWPLFHIDSFQAVTGPKADLWLVYTVACLVVAIGTALVVAAISGRITPEVGVLAIGSAAGLAGIDVVFVARGVISWVYLLDAAAEFGLIVWWTLTYVGPRMGVTTRSYAHLQQLLQRRRAHTEHPVG